MSSGDNQAFKSFGTPVILLPIHKPSRIKHAVSGYFMSTQTKDLVITRDYCLDFMSMENGVLVHKCSLSTGKEVDSLSIFNPPEKKSRKRHLTSPADNGLDWLAILMSDGSFYLCSYFAGRFINTCIGVDDDYFRFRRIIEPFFVSTSTSLSVYSRPGNLVTFKSNGKTPEIVERLRQGDLSPKEKILSEGKFSCLPQFETIAAAFINNEQEILIVGRENSQFYLSEGQLKNDKLVINSQYPIKEEYNALIPLRKVSGRQMVLLLGNEHVCLWKSETQIAGKPIKIRYISCHVELKGEKAASRFLLGTNSGNFHVLSINLETGAMDTSTIDYQAESPSQIVHLQDDIYFIRNSMTDPEIVRVCQRESSSFDVIYEMIRLDRLDSCYPILDFSPRIDASNRLEILACCGGPPSGALTRLEYGYELESLATADVDKGINECWILKKSDRLMCAFSAIYGTRVFEIETDGNFKTLDIPIDLDSESQLIFLHEDTIHQVTNQKIMSEKAGVLYESDESIQKAAYNGSEICLVSEAKKLIVVSLINGTQKAHTFNHKITAIHYTPKRKLIVALENSEVYELSSTFGIERQTFLAAAAFSITDIGEYLYVSTSRGVFDIHNWSEPVLIVDIPYLCRLYPIRKLSIVITSSLNKNYVINEQTSTILNAGKVSCIADIGEAGKNIFDSDESFLVVRSTDSGDQEILVSQLPEQSTMMIQRKEAPDAVRRLLRIGNRMIVTLRLVYDEGSIAQSEMPRCTVVELRDSDSLEVLDSVQLADFELGECLEVIKNKHFDNGTLRFIVGVSVRQEEMREWEPFAKKPRNGISGRAILFSANEKKLRIIYSEEFIEGGVTSVKYSDREHCCYVACRDLLFTLRFDQDGFKRTLKTVPVSNDITGIDCELNQKVVANMSGSIFITSGEKPWITREIYRLKKLKKTIDRIRDRVIMTTSPIIVPRRGVKNEFHTIMIGTVGAASPGEDTSSTALHEICYYTKDFTDFFFSNTKETPIHAIGIKPIIGLEQVVVVATADGGLYLYDHVQDSSHKQILACLSKMIETQTDCIGVQNEHEIHDVIDLRHLEKYWLMTKEQKRQGIEKFDPQARASLNQQISDQVESLDEFVRKLNVVEYLSNRRKTH